MNPSPVFPEVPLEPYEVEVGLEQERSRLGGARARPVLRRTPPGRRTSPPRARPRPPVRPLPWPRPRPRPRPVPLPPSWPPFGAGYLIPLGDGAGAPVPSSATPPGAIVDDERWRCVQACFGRTADASSAPAPDELEYEGPYDFEGEYESGGGMPDECPIIDLTAQAERGHRKGTRDPKSVYALVLHQMGCCAHRRDPLRNYLRTKAHFVIVPDGRILQLHPVSALLFASNGFNSGSVAVEFAGNFPSVRGRWWRGATYGRDRPTSAQLQAGRCLVRHLIRTMGLRVVLAHRQSSGSRENDPGPEVWSQVGQWAVDTLGLSDGGHGFKIHKGHPIPDAWRTWGRGGTAPESEDEYEGEGEGEGDRELETSPGLMSLPAAIADPRAAGAGIYTLFKDGQRVYAGRAENLRRRLQQHLLCLTHIKLKVSRFRVKLTPLPGASPTQLSRVESAVIGRFGRTSRGGQLANVKSREF